MGWEESWELIMGQFWALVRAPLDVPELWWVLAPLIAVTLIMTLYFGKYFREELGWNTALGNSVVLFFVGIDLLRTLVQMTDSLYLLALHPIKVVFILAVMCEAMLMARLAFRHAIPSKVMFFIAQPVSVNVQAYVAAVIVYTNAVPDRFLLGAAVLLFLVIFAALRVVQEAEHLLYRYHFRGEKRAKSR